MEYMKRILTIGVILLFIGSISSTPAFNEEQSPTQIYDGKTLYVGGSGPGNYTKIQDAIDDASDEDTVFVYDDSSPYYEKLVVDKSINLLGEDRETTVIDGGEYNYRTIVITSDDVIVQDFTIFGQIIIEANSSRIFNNNIICLKCTCIILIGQMNGTQFSYTKIYGNALISNSNCIVIWFSDYSLIAGNSIICRGGKGYVGIGFVGNFSLIYLNTIKESDVGIFFMGCNSSIYHNNVSNCNKSLSLVGISNFKCRLNEIYMNTFRSSKVGLYLTNANESKIYENNFVKNLQNAFFWNSNNQWQRNYWERPRFFPKFIFGMIKINSKTMPWFNFDWHPAQEPYDI
jgi:parallel beta-helix repeat protein